MLPGPSNLIPFRTEIEEIKVNTDTIFGINMTKDTGTHLIRKSHSLKLHLSHIDAAFICSGPFRLMLTLELENHLILGDDGYLRVYWDFEPQPGGRLCLFEDHFVWDRTLNVATVRNCSVVRQLMREIKQSHALLFDRNSAARKLGRRFYGMPCGQKSNTTSWIDESLSVSLDPFTFENIPIEIALQKFPWLGERMIHLLETMENWKPTRFRELFTPRYVERTSWWIAMFGIFFGFMSILLVVLGGYQIYLSK